MERTSQSLGNVVIMNMTVIIQNNIVNNYYDLCIIVQDISKFGYFTNNVNIIIFTSWSLLAHL